MEEFRTSYLLDCNMEYVLWDILRNFFQPRKQCYQSCQSFHYLSIRREINRKDFDKYNREKSKYSKYKVMVDRSCSLPPASLINKESLFVMLKSSYFPPLLQNLPRAPCSIDGGSALLNRLFKALYSLALFLSHLISYHYFQVSNPLMMLTTC